MRANPALILLFLLAGVASAQPAAPAQTPQANEPTTFRSQSELVLVPVVVTDNKGAHVAGLKEEDFALLDNGQPRKLTLFREVKKEEGEAKPLVFQGGYTNMSAANNYRQHACIVVLDTINTPMMLRENGRRHLLKFLEQSAKQGQPLAILLLTPSGIKQLTSFRSSPEELARMVRALQLPAQATDIKDTDSNLVNESALGTGTGFDSALAMMAAKLQESADGELAYRARDRARQTLLGLQQIAKSYAGMPGRKMLVWATVGVPFFINDPQAFQGQDSSTVQLYEETMRALASTDMAIFPIDLEGLLDLPAMQASTASPHFYEGRSLPNNVRVDPALDAKSDMQAGMRMLAEATGGQAFYNSNDLASLFKRAVEESQSYYLLGFTLTGTNRTTGWHKLKVKTTEPKFHLATRSGYFVGPASTESQKPQAEAQAALRDAMESAVEISDMRVNVLLTGDTTEEKNGAPVKTQMFSINLEPGDFVVNTAEKNLVDLTFSAAALDARHAVISSSTKQVHAKLTAKTLEGLSTGGLSVRDKMEAPPQTRELRFAVRDNQSGKVGSVVIMLARASAKK